MTTLHFLAAASPYLFALVVGLVIGAIGILIWVSMPEPGNADIERQIATLRRNADHAVATRPRVRAISQNSVSEAAWLRAERRNGIADWTKARTGVNSPTSLGCTSRQTAPSNSAGSNPAASTPPSSRADHLPAAGKLITPKACGRGLCRHQADCSDVYCPGRSGPDHHAGR